MLIKLLTTFGCCMNQFTESLRFSINSKNLKLGYMRNGVIAILYDGVIYKFVDMVRISEKTSKLYFVSNTENTIVISFIRKAIYVWIEIILYSEAIEKNIIISGDMINKLHTFFRSHKENNNLNEMFLSTFDLNDLYDFYA